jgi:hypothetical protein
MNKRQRREEDSRALEMTRQRAEEIQQIHPCKPELVHNRFKELQIDVKSAQ